MIVIVETPNGQLRPSKIYQVDDLEEAAGLLAPDGLYYPPEQITKEKFEDHCFDDEDEHMIGTWAVSTPEGTDYVDDKPDFEEVATEFIHKCAERKAMSIQIIYNAKEMRELLYQHLPYPLTEAVELYGEMLVKERWY